MLRIAKGILWGAVAALCMTMFTPSESQAQYRYGPRYGRWYDNGYRPYYYRNYGTYYYPYNFYYYNYPPRPWGTYYQYGYPYRYYGYRGPGGRVSVGPVDVWW